MLTKEQIKILKEAISFYGHDMQKTVAIEEMSEVTKEICKDKRGKYDECHMAEEIADLEIMTEQLKIIYENHILVEVYRTAKIERLNNKIIEDKICKDFKEEA